MKKTTLFIFLILIFVLIIVILPDLTYSQPPPPPGKPAQTPVDGGLSLLAAGGAAYAVKKLKERRQGSVVSESDKI